MLPDEEEEGGTVLMLDAFDAEVVEEIDAGCGSIGKGAWLRGQDESPDDDAQDMEERAEALDHRELWPDDPELVEDTDMRGWWEKFAVGGMKAVAWCAESSSVTVVNECPGFGPHWEAISCGERPSTLTSLGDDDKLDATG